MAWISEGEGKENRPLRMLPPIVLVVWLKTLHLVWMMRIRKATRLPHAFVWTVALASFTTLGHARAQEPGGPAPVGVPPPPASFQTTVIQGAVAQYLMNPDGVVDGLLLENNAFVRFPPHLGQVLAGAVRPQDVVRVEGFLEVPGTIHATSIVDLQSQRALVDTPPSQKHPRPPPPNRASRQPLSAQGTIRALTRAKHGEVDGAVLSEGTIIHFPPQAAPALAALLHEGNPLAATGNGTANEYGRSLEATAMGPSPDQLQPIAPGPGPKPPPRGASPLPSPPPP